MRARGFTILEMLVAATIALLAIGMTMGVFLSQNRAFVTLDYARDANGNGRDAILEMQASLKRAGFGVDPSLAFDFSCPSGTNCHDRINAPDEITFYSRNANYVWTPQNNALGCNTVGGCFGGGTIWAVQATGTQVTINVTGNTVLYPGQNVLVVCPMGGDPKPVFAKVLAKTTSAGPSPMNVSINSTGIYANGSFQACHTQPGAALFLVDKFHYFVTTLNNEPWLVLDTGLNYDGTSGVWPNATAPNNLIPVARGVEDFQIAYQIGPAVVPPFTTVSAPDTNANWVVGDDPGKQEEPQASAAPPLSGASSGTLNPGNIRSVRVTLVLRSSQGDSSLNPNGGDAPFASENRNDVSAVSVSQFRRYPQTFSVAIRNMTVPNPYLLF